MLNYRSKSKFITIAIALAVVLGYQQCSKVAVEDLSSQKGTGITPDGPGGQGDPTDPNNPDDPTNPNDPKDPSDPADPVNPVPKPHRNNVVLKADYSELDIILVVDNSGSMQADSQHLASRLEGFIKALEASTIDWQMCLIRTDYNLSNGNAQSWVGLNGGRSHILNSNVSNIGSVFMNTISAMDFGARNTGDERGIAALRANLDARSSNECYRQGSVVTTIVISDEDVRSNRNNIQSIDRAENLIAKFMQVLPENKLISNSIVIKSGDQTCLDAQKKQSEAYYGKEYETLSMMTQGAIGSICAPDYTTVLSEFATVIKKSFKDVELDCEPIGGINGVTVTAADNSSLNYTLSGRTLHFESSLQQDLAVQIDYQCMERP